MKYAQIKAKLAEAATHKSQAKKFLRDLDEMLTDKKIPDDLRRQIEDVRNGLKRTWADLAKDAAIPTRAAEAAKTVPADKEEAFKACKLKLVGDGKDESQAYAVCYAQVVEGKSEAEAMKECGDEYANPMPSVTPWGSKSFADLDANEAANEATQEIYERTSQLQQLVSNVMGDPLTTDKVSALRVVFDEYTTLIAGLTGANLTASESDDTQPEGVKLAESFNGASIVLEEVELSETVPSPRDPLRLDVRMITPGWGNATDKNYYPPDVLKRDAKVFEGVKMYTTDHKPGEKSERTEVSIVEKIIGFADDGAPIAQVLVFDPDFAEKTRNRAKAKMLETLECSILANGRTKPGTAPDGRKGNIVEAITSAQSLDWVTKAGAGGRAERLAESAQGTGAIMDKTLILKTLKESALPEPAQKRLGEREFSDEAELKKVIESEVAYLKEVATPATPALLSESDVKAVLVKTTLPAASQKRLAETQYADSAALESAVKAEVAYLKEVTLSGKPNMQQSQAQGQSVTLAERNKAKDEVLESYFGGRPTVAPVKGA